MTETTVRSLIAGTLKPLPLAALRRRLQPGVKLRLVYGPAGEQNLPRVVVKATSSGICMKGSQTMVRLPWSGKRAYATARGFELHCELRNSVLRYEWVEDGRKVAGAA